MIDGQVVLYGFIVHGMCCEAGLAEGGQVFLFWGYIGGRVWNLRIYDFCFYLSACAVCNWCFDYVMWTTYLISCRAYIALLDCKVGYAGEWDGCVILDAGQMWEEVGG